MNFELVARIALEAAEKAAEIQRYYYKNAVRVQFKGEVDLLTQADLESQAVIIKTIQSSFPDHKILAEENQQGHNENFKGPIWVVDPLDGTTNFAHRYPMFGISMALVIDNAPQYGLVYHPLLNEIFTAQKGRGAFLNRERIHVSSKNDFKQAFLSTGFPYDKRENPNNNLELFNLFELSSLCVRRGGAAAIDLAYVACGRIDGFWEPKLKPWDIAAGILLIEEAGGKISDYAGLPLTNLRTPELVASNGKIHTDIVALTISRRIAP